MRVPAKLALFCAALSVFAAAAFSDEIRLKDGKKLYGVIVAYEDNMFRIKTDFGFVLVERDKIASIIPSTPASDAPATTKPTRNVEKKSASDSAAAGASTKKPANTSAATEEPPEDRKSVV